MDNKKNTALVAAIHQHSAIAEETYLIFLEKDRSLVI